MISTQIDERTIAEESRRQPELVYGDESDAFELFNVLDGEIEACFRAVIEDDGFDDLTGCYWESEEAAGNSVDNPDVRDLLFDETDDFDGAPEIILIPIDTTDDGQIADDVLRQNGALRDCEAKR